MLEKEVEQYNVKIRAALSEHGEELKNLELKCITSEGLIT